MAHIICTLGFNQNVIEHLRGLQWDCVLWCSGCCPRQRFLGCEKQFPQDGESWVRDMGVDLEVLAGMLHKDGHSCFKIIPSQSIFVSELAKLFQFSAQDMSKWKPFFFQGSPLDASVRFSPLKRLSFQPQI